MVTKASHYKYIVEYKKGKEHVAADGLSRRDEVDSPSLLTVVAVESDWIQQVREMVISDNYFEDIKIKLDGGKLDPRLYQKKSGLIDYNGRILISPNSTLTQVLILEHHDTPQGGHSGYAKFLQRLKKVVYWKGFKNSVRDYIKLCDICQRSKYESLSPARLSQPLPIPDQTWEEITMDFIDCLQELGQISYFSSSG